MGERTNNVGGDMTINLVNMMEVSTVINYHPVCDAERKKSAQMEQNEEPGTSARTRRAPRATSSRTTSRATTTRCSSRSVHRARVGRDHNWIMMYNDVFKNLPSRCRT